VTHRRDSAVSVAVSPLPGGFEQPCPRPACGTRMLAIAALFTDLACAPWQASNLADPADAQGSTDDTGR
jgi:hypothetical protein